MPRFEAKRILKNDVWMDITLFQKSLLEFPQRTAKKNVFVLKILVQHLFTESFYFKIDV